MVNPLPPPQDDLSRRRPVWDALSNLFLDTELTEKDYRWIAGVLVDSAYDDAQLDYVLFNEVYPVLFWNTISVAGEWTGFDLDWLQDRILRNERRFLKVWRLLQPNRSLVEEAWKQVQQFIREARMQREHTQG